MFGLFLTVRNAIMQVLRGDLARLFAPDAGHEVVLELGDRRRRDVRVYAREGAGGGVAAALGDGWRDVSGPLGLVPVDLTCSRQQGGSASASGSTTPTEMNSSLGIACPVLMLNQQVSPRRVYPTARHAPDRGKFC